MKKRVIAMLMIMATSLMLIGSVSAETLDETDAIQIMEEPSLEDNEGIEPELCIEANDETNSAFEDEEIEFEGEEAEEVVDSATATVITPMRPGLGVVTEKERIVLKWFRDNKTSKNSVQFKAINLILSGDYLHKVYGSGGFNMNETWVKRDGTNNTRNKGFYEPSFDCSGFVTTLYGSIASDDVEFQTFCQRNGVPKLSNCTTMYKSKWATRASDYFTFDEVKERLSTGDLLLIRSETTEKLSSHVLFYLGVLPERISNSIGLEPGLCLAVDARSAAEPLLDAENGYANMGGVQYTLNGETEVKTNWGVQIRSYTGDRCVGYLDMNQFNEKKDFTLCEVSNIPNREYTGRNITCDPVVTYDGMILTKNKDYVVSCSNNRKIGIAKVRISGKGSYAGAVLTSFKIRPKGTALTKVSSSRKGIIKVAWNKRITQTTGYQVQYALNSKFTNSSVWQRSDKTLSSKTIAGLKSGKKYYVRIRTFKTVNGEKIYSKWSEASSVRVK